ncbi:GNAT family N-acetyltransferase [Trichocoleus sp. DQ-A3]|uniref:GNAT family N-acetyltransferase n=1 Tax=Cyanophyceae TaxID=3028117 RepID=UPI0016859566|nr:MULTISPECIES: GNAT family N-acetyltransferase [unclassified Coleofasciculus]MBD1899719.1 GNAT family N-acetyltransferase [Coleofasciculus sp. FACHB-125]MBD2538087.1 GNAT family N-acetyltransferase [Coleofasciculus sp. FACHB-SPT36]
MADLPPSLPPGCVLRPARAEEKWLIQQLLLEFTKSEALKFDLRVLSFNFLILIALTFFMLAIIQIIKILASNFLLGIILFLILALLFIVTLCLAASFILFFFSIFTYAFVNWSRFWVIECNGRLVACGEINGYSTHSMLYYLFVKPVWRSQHLGSHLVKRLVQEATHPLYLVCKPKLVRFYSQLGFTIVPWQEISQPLKSSFHIFQLDTLISGNVWTVMRYQS